LESQTIKKSSDLCSTKPFAFGLNWQKLYTVALEHTDWKL